MTSHPARKSKKLSKNRKKNASSWKKVNNAHKLSKRHQKKLVYITTAGIVFCLCLGGISIFTIQNKYNTNFASAAAENQRALAEDDIVAIANVYISETEAHVKQITEANIFFYDLKNEKMYKIVVSPDMLIDMPGRYGEEVFAKTFAFGLIANNDDPEAAADYVVFTLENILGYSLNRYLFSPEAVKSNIQGFFSATSGVSKYSIGFLSGFGDAGVQTNISAGEMSFLYSTASKAEFIEDELFVDSQDMQSQISAFIRDITFDSNIAVEGKSVVVLNATDVSGVATKTASIVENMGGHVIENSNSIKKYDRSFIVTDNPNYYIVQELQDYFDIVDFYATSPDDSIPISELNRGDVILVIGFDIANRL